ncbi:PREDICTED: uncharacterized protein LOC105449984 isoform X2 [Wasmannia auropunctata]|uniref:uncharacterized protein LOC105449984 isoform X2 n=1 Tax=Wasmannia auropunctata TaxID=64793 RepID=UPI0005EE5451|nr:PREDICTED: uncharacterized protein LOC105449984 isoform X2 [Wasmannia auropunctata]
MDCHYYKQSPINNRQKRYNRRKNEKSFRNRQCSKSEAGAKVTCSIPLKKYNSTVKLFQSRCQMRKTNRTTAKISKYHILESKYTGRDICRKILDTDIGLTSECYRNINLDSIIPALSRIMEMFKNRHNKYNYADKLKNIIAKNSTKYAVNHKFKHQIHVHSLQYFFSLLVYENVPLKLFGTSRNQKAIKKTVCCLLKTVPQKISITKAFKRNIQKADAIGASLDMMPLFNKLDISKINWLYSIDNNTEKWIIVLKLLHWFFTQYIIKILHKYVVLKVSKRQWIYITKDNWINMQEEFVNKKLNICEPCLVPFTELNKKYITGIYKFIPSSSGVRAIFLAKYNIKDKYDDVVLRFLQQLYITHFNEKGIPTVADCKKTISNYIWERSGNPLYFVRCDIQDAFDSIIQENIIGKRICTFRKPKQNRKKNTVQIVSNYLKKLTSSNIIPSNERPKRVRKQMILHKIKELIFQKKVKLIGRRYSIIRGVSQGVSTSSILSDIYYQQMIKEQFSEYTKNGLLSTYVDDMLYITDDKNYAVRFLEIIENGIHNDEYDVTFNPDKIQSNVEVSSTSTNSRNISTIKFLGWNVPKFR